MERTTADPLDTRVGDVRSTLEETDNAPPPASQLREYEETAHGIPETAKNPPPEMRVEPFREQTPSPNIAALYPKVKLRTTYQQRPPVAPPETPEK